MLELPSLYDHQSSLKDRTREALTRHRRVILCAQPGVGKTRCAKWILGASAMRQPRASQSGRSLFTVHRRGLVDNALHSFTEEPLLPHGVVMSGKQPNWEHRTQVASIDTMLSWFVKGEQGQNVYDSEWTFDLVVVDETHAHLSKFHRFLKAHDEARERLGLHPAYVIGLTATPQCKGLADVYSEIVLGPSTQWLIENGYLSPFRYFQGTQGRLELLQKRGDRFTDKSQKAAFDGLAGDLVRDWKRFAEGRPTAGFFPRRSHAREAQAELQRAGLKVEYIDGKTKDEERHRIFDDLNNRRIDYLCNVQVVERGTDIPAIACVQVCVAIANLARWRQIIGRGSRVAPGKSDVVILDHAGCLQRGVGFFEDEPQWSLDVTSKDVSTAAERPTIECPQCSAVYRGGLCKSCGYEPTRSERRSQGLEFEGGELTEVKKKPSRKVRDAQSLMVEALYRTGKSGRTWRQSFGLFKRLNKDQGTDYRVPRHVEVGGHRYEMLRYDSVDSGRRVSDLFPFVSGKGNHGGAYHRGEVEAKEPEGVLF